VGAIRVDRARDESEGGFDVPGPEAFERQVEFGV
jgi:hypothetical protein